MFSKIKYFIQRGKRGYADCDVWNLNDYLADMLFDALKQLNREKLGYPCNYPEEEWTKILNDMIAGFRAYKQMDKLHFWSNENEKTKYLKQRKALEEICNKGLKLFAENFYDLWD